MPHPLIVAAFVAAVASQGVLQLPAPDPNAPPVIDMAVRMVRAASGGSSIARSAARGDEQAFVYIGLGPCRTGASESDPAHENSTTWRAGGRVRSVERGIAIADVEWQRIDYRPSGITAGPRVRMTLNLPLGERVAVDFAAEAGTACRMDGAIFEIGVAPDHGRRLAMSAEGRAATATTGARGGGGGGVGTRIGEEQLERQRLGIEAARAAPIVNRPMPPREYGVDLWLVDRPIAALAPILRSRPSESQRLSKTIGGTGGRFDFPPITLDSGIGKTTTLEISTLVIPVGGDQLIVAITRHTTSADGSPDSAGWLKTVAFPKADDVISFESPAAGLGLRLRISKGG